MNNILLEMSLTKLKNEVHVQFNESVNSFVVLTGIEKLGLEKLHPQYLLALGNEKEALDYMRVSSMTALIIEQDKYRNMIFRGLSDTVKGLTCHYNSEARQAGLKLWTIFQFHGNITQKPLDAKTAAINDLLREITAEGNSEILEAAELVDWAKVLSEENSRFHAMMIERYGESTGKSPYRMKTARKETDKYYRAMINKVENRILEGDTRDDFNSFVVGLNAIITRFKSILSQESGKIKNVENEVKDEAELI